MINLRNTVFAEPSRKRGSIMSCNFHAMHGQNATAIKTTTRQSRSRYKRCFLSCASVSTYEEEFCIKLTRPFRQKLFCLAFVSVRAVLFSSKLPGWCDQTGKLEDLKHRHCNRVREDATKGVAPWF